jgi:hypothetical protein
VQKLCLEEKVPGVTRFSNTWVIPEDTPKPTRTGKSKPGRKPKQDSGVNDKNAGS